MFARIKIQILTKEKKNPASYFGHNPEAKYEPLCQTLHANLCVNFEDKNEMSPSGKECGNTLYYIYTHICIPVNNTVYCPALLWTVLQPDIDCPVLVDPAVKFHQVASGQLLTISRAG